MLAFALGLAPLPTAAQDSNFALSAAAGPDQTSGRTAGAGWTFTPSLLYQAGYDDNALLRATQDQAPSDVLSVVNPRADATYVGRKGGFSASYDGAFLLYHTLDQLNSYDQHATVGGRRLLSPHVSLFVNNNVAIVPTTELLQLVAVPFVRTGAKYDDLRGGINADLTKYTSITATYGFEWVQFDRNQPLGFNLHGGSSQGGSFDLRRRLTENTSLVADYDLQHALITEGGTFNVQNVSAGLEHQFSTHTRFFASAGLSHLGISDLGGLSAGPAGTGRGSAAQGPSATAGLSRTGPAWHVSLSHSFRVALVDVSYSRTYVPAFGFGGTSQNEEADAFVRAPVGRRAYLQTDVAWRRDQPLLPSDPYVRSVWLEGVVGYLLQPWVRAEVFYSGTTQTSNFASGVYGHNRIGVQIVTAKPMRMR